MRFFLYDEAVYTTVCLVAKVLKCLPLYVVVLITFMQSVLF